MRHKKEQDLRFELQRIYLETGDREILNKLRDTIAYLSNIITK